MTRPRSKYRDFFLFNDLLIKATRSSETSLAFRGKVDLASSLAVMTYPSVWIQVRPHPRGLEGPSAAVGPGSVCLHLHHGVPPPRTRCEADPDVHNNLLHIWAQCCSTGQPRGL